MEAVKQKIKTSDDCWAQSTQDYIYSSAAERDSEILSGNTAGGSIYTKSITVITEQYHIIFYFSSVLLNASKHHSPGSWSTFISQTQPLQSNKTILSAIFFYKSRNFTKTSYDFVLSKSHSLVKCVIFLWQRILTSCLEIVISWQKKSLLKTKIWKITEVCDLGQSQSQLKYWVRKLRFWKGPNFTIETVILQQKCGSFGLCSLSCEVMIQT